MYIKKSLIIDLDKTIKPMKASNPINTELCQDIKQPIEESKQRVTAQVNYALVLTYWHIKRMIKTDVLQNERAEYGKAVIKQLS